MTFEISVICANARSLNPQLSQLGAARATSL
jgi:hypothetical protein